MTDLEAKAQLAACDHDFDQSWLDIVWVDNLGSSLRWGGALCAAHQHGWEQRMCLRADGLVAPWHPGCGYSVIG